ncbi:MAG TPA: CoA-acylating methylmalonate-semialdehyde dehydrogenase [Frankiaceae bacterium]|nr:CoA-acylating methylmalonate-semialdehyde dehydrogenase [Frankiaceae bacterium]
MERIGHWIDGQHRPGTSGRSQAVWNPTTGEAQSDVDLASAAEVDAAVASALAAFPEWSAKSLAARTQVMFRFRELLDGNRKALAEAVSREHGKTAADADGEIARGLDNVDFACGLAQLLKGSYSDSVSSGIDVYSLRQPLGVVAGITPFNFPAMVPLWMIPTAIACGNAFILKPSERDPSASLMLADLLRQAGVPDGVVNVVQGDREAVERLLEHPDVQAVSFVGSTDIARHIYATGTAHGKRVQALGGAKNHMVVLPDADLGLAADAAVSAGYGSAGERCMAISVVVAVGAIADPLVEAIAERLPGIQVGTGTGGASEMGPLITAQHRDRVAGYLAQAPEEGAQVRVDGRQVPAADGPGFYLGASLLDHVKPGSKAHQDEIFGPVLSVVRVDTYEQAMRVVGDSPYGNGAAIFTRDGGVARSFMRDVQAGMVGVNVPIPVPVAQQSFGGWKGSLFGDLHMYGPEGMQFYTRGKVVTSRWPEIDGTPAGVQLGFPQNDGR